MARKKQEIALQTELETQEEWEEMLTKEGLTVVDIYQEWCGPCKAMVSNFRRLKNELGDDLLHFAMAKSDTIDALERYRGKCEPCFLFFAGGVLVAVIRGAKVPLMWKSVTEQLKTEHTVLDGNAERKEIRDPFLADMEDREPTMDDEDDEEEEGGLLHKGERIIFESLPELADEEEAGEQIKKGVTVAIIKPNVVADGKVEEVLESLKEAGIVVLEDEEKTLTEDEAREFYSHKKDEEYFEDLVTFMSSGPSHVLVLTKGETGDGIIEEWRDLLGPPTVEEARENAPDSLRAKYGRENYVNALHGSDSSDTAMQELAFFFPNFVVPTFAGKTKKVKLQRTLALIRPDALKEKKDEILLKIEEAGFRVAMQKEMLLSREQAEYFYKEHEDQEYFKELIDRMTCGPLLALALAREDAIEGWRDLLGPKEVEKAKEEAPSSFRAQFSVEDVPINQIHGSDTEEAAKKEMEYFFPMEQTIAVVKPDAFQTKDQVMDKIREAGFHIAARKETELTKDIASQFYRDQENKEYYDDLTEHMCSGPTLFMVLSREDAVNGWRSLMGPTDPQKAKEENPESLRALYGTDIKSNAIHGSSTSKQAQDNMNLIFGDLDFNPDGGAIKGNKSEESEGVEDQQEEGESKEQAQEQTDESQEQTEGSQIQTEEQKDDSDQQTEQTSEEKDDQQTTGRGSPTPSQKSNQSQKSNHSHKSNNSQKSNHSHKSNHSEKSTHSQKNGNDDEEKDDKKEEKQKEEQADTEVATETKGESEGEKEKEKKEDGDADKKSEGSPEEKPAGETDATSQKTDVTEKTEDKDSAKSDGKTSEDVDKKLENTEDKEDSNDKGDEKSGSKEEKKEDEPKAETKMEDPSEEQQAKEENQDAKSEAEKKEADGDKSRGQSPSDDKKNEGDSSSQKREDTEDKKEGAAGESSDTEQDKKGDDQKSVSGSHKGEDEKKKDDDEKDNKKDEDNKDEEKKSDDNKDDKEADNTKADEKKGES